MSEARKTAKSSGLSTKKVRKLMKKGERAKKRNVKFSHRVRSYKKGSASGYKAW